jgi:hypothetical protein
MTHLDRQQLADIYASTHAIAVIGASADPDAAVLARRMADMCSKPICALGTARRTDSALGALRPTWVARWRGRALWSGVAVRAR